MPKSKKFPKGKNKKQNLMKLTEKECYCDIVGFYDLLALRLGVGIDRVRYNCTKIHVTEPVRKKIFAFYKEQNGASEGETAMDWVLGGPKADLKQEGYFAEIEDGFFIEERE